MHMTTRTCATVYLSKQSAKQTEKNGDRLHAFLSSVMNAGE